MNNKHISKLDVQAKLLSLVQSQILDCSKPQERISLGPLEVLDFSTCFSIEWQNGGRRRGIYVKIPKTEAQKKVIWPLTAADRQMAEEEYRSLKLLEQYWQGSDLNVHFIKPLAFFPEYNAIVSERVYATDLFQNFRRFDLKQKWGPNSTANPMHDIMFRLGKALSRFHQPFRQPENFNWDNAAEKIRMICRQLFEMGASKNWWQEIEQIIQTKNIVSAPTYITNTIKGLDIRNMLIDLNGVVFLLDPGRLRMKYQEEDLARFIVTCRILYWGSPWFFLNLTPHKSFEGSFLKGYYDAQKPSTLLIDMFILKELLKHWRMAYVVLRQKRWPKSLKFFLKHTYIDPCYERQLSGCLASLA